MGNTADSCRREFSNETYHVRIGERHFCSHTSAAAWIEQARVFNILGNPFRDIDQPRRRAG
jgi:hypothetical protein